MSWVHHNPVRIIAGAGSRRELGRHAPGGKVLLLTSAGMLRRGTADELMRQHTAATWHVDTISANPELDDLDQLAVNLRATDFKAIVALGGGSVMDAAKVLSVLLRASGKSTLQHWLREENKPCLPEGVPVYCLPTTAGTGAEVTPFATVWDSKAARKHSLAGEQLYPIVALLDPELTLTLPWEETLYSALDALSHSLETLWNKYATPVSAALALRALDMILANLQLVKNNLAGLNSREQLQQASTLAGLAISQNRTALAHSMSYPLTVRYGVPHGLACSFMLPALIRKVQAEDCWLLPLGPDREERLIQLLLKYRLPERVSAYCRHNDILACLDKMIDPQRADNFVVKLSSIEIENIINDVFSQQEQNKGEITCH